MNIMVTGSGGREHALAYAIAETAGGQLDNLYIAPGNAGTAEVGENVDISVTDIAGQARFARQNNIDLAVVGPDGMLADGMVDAFEDAGVPAFGPTQDAAKIEWSKDFAKEIMRERGIPTAPHASFDDPSRALGHLARGVFPKYIKADGLAAGKGAVEVRDLEEGEQVIRDMMVDRKFGDAGARIVIEDHLGGSEVPEISLHALTDGTTYLMFPAAQDHKTIGENHQGLMTGGMGTVSPLPGVDRQLVAAYGEQIVAPLLEGLRARGIDYRGLIYPGLKLPDGQPRVLEYNSRFGDPETQVYARLVESGFLDALRASREGTLDEVDLRWRDMAAVCVVLASAGYPESSQKGAPIDGIADANRLEGVHVFHAGTANKGGQVVTNGGRVLNVTALGNTLEEARARAYQGVAQIHFPGMQFRRDIGVQALGGIRAV